MMTTAKKLKRQVRTRAAKTGESYTAARAQLLQTDEVRGMRAAGREPQNGITAAISAAPKSIDPRTVKTPGFHNDRFVEKTGHGLDFWFAALDESGEASSGHTAMARWMGATYPDVDGWWVQSVVVEYERERGLRAVHQNCDGEWEISASKTIKAPMADVLALLQDESERAAWLEASDERVSGVLADAPALRQRDKGDARWRHKSKAAVLEVSFDFAPNGVKATFRAHKLATREDLALWKVAMKQSLQALDAIVVKGGAR